MGSIGTTLAFTLGATKTEQLFQPIRQEGKAYMDTKLKDRRKMKNRKPEHPVSIRQLKKELKLIPNDIKREMRFLDLLLTENNQVRTQVEKEVVGDFIVKAKAMVEYHQGRLERFEACYRQIKEKNSFDFSLLRPEELQNLLEQQSAVAHDRSSVEKPPLRTGTHG